MPDLTAAEQAIRDALAGQRWEFPPGSGFRSGPHAGHNYEGWCAVCRRDLDAIARVAAEAVRPSCGTADQFGRDAQTTTHTGGDET